MSTLTSGSQLQSGKYEIVKVLGQGGFGITYLVRHIMLDTYYAVKEFFPQDYCNRDSTTSHITVATQANTELVSRLRNRFVTEARNMTRLKHSGIISIHDIFEENGTAYYVMDYIEGKSLDEMVTEDGPMQENKALEYIRKVSDAVSYIHDHHITHFDLKPANIMVRRVDNQPVLIDFGLSKQYTESGHARSTLLMGVSHGFSPLEQYMQDGIETFSPRTDVYALGATLYFLVTGRIPPEALKLVGTDIEVPESVSLSTRDAIKWAMKPLRQERCPSAQVFLESLDPSQLVSDGKSGSSVREDESLENNQEPLSQENPEEDVTGYGINVQEPLQDPEHEYYSDEDNDYDAKSSNKRIWIYCAIALVIVVLGGYLLFSNGDKPSESDQPDAGYSDVVEHEASDEDLSIRGNENESNNLSESEIQADQIDEQKDNEANLIESKTSDKILPSGEEESRLVEEMKKKEETTKESIKEKIQPDTHSAQNDDQIYDVVDEFAQFPGGTASLIKYLSSNLHYPPVAQENGIQGRVLVKFVVEKDGSISNVQVIKGVDKDLNQEALRVVRAMPKWMPGKKNGVTVKSFYTLPISFKLQ